MAWAGTVTQCKSDPRGATIQPPGDPPPPPIALTDISDDAWDLLRDGLQDGKPLAGTGVPPTCGSVTKTK